MPYIIHTPHASTPFLTHNPIIYMDALSFGWGATSHSYYSSEFKEMAEREERLGRREYREAMLERIWGEEGERRRFMREMEREKEKRHNKDETVELGDVMEANAAVGLEMETEKEIEMELGAHRERSMKLVGVFAGQRIEKAEETVAGDVSGLVEEDSLDVEEQDAFAGVQRTAREGVEGCLRSEEDQSDSSRSKAIAPEKEEDAPCTPRSEGSCSCPSSVEEAVRLAGEGLLQRCVVCDV